MAATGGAVGGLFDVLSNPAVSTPAGFALAVILYLGKLWLDSRKERRNDRDDRRTDESHIVEETKDILAVRREEMADFRAQVLEDRRYMGELEAENRKLRRQCSDLDELRQENDELREILADRLGQRYVGNGGVSPSATGEPYGNPAPGRRTGTGSYPAPTAGGRRRRPE